ncbi:serine/threonine-protein kinase PLK2 [Latimeria chalumnae]|uniref:serine/threonine-protein kinase PLK2 n=1 Tax=Latimeria chalumnae TaxID=7897 RepID=UPI00313CC0AD
MRENSQNRSTDKEKLKYFIQDPASGILYQRGKLLGKGAFGRCYKFTDTTTNAIYAVKIIPQSIVFKLGQRDKVNKEVALHGTLKHRNIVKFEHHFEDEENIYLIMELCSKKSLAHILGARKMLTEPEVRYYVTRILCGLKYLHQKEIVHRDIKLSNFFVTKNMEVKIGDFGLAIKVDQTKEQKDIICGTPNYLAPEVINKKGSSYKSDIWALGCIMYTMLTGHSPFSTSNLKKMYQCIREGKYTIPDYISPAAKELLTSLMANSPAGRPSLEEIMQHEFFTQGFTPKKLSSRSCHSAPSFHESNPLREVLHKATRILFGEKHYKEAHKDEHNEICKLEGDLKKVSARFNENESIERETTTIQCSQQTDTEQNLNVQLILRRSLKRNRSNSLFEPDCFMESVANSVARVLKGCLENILDAEQNPMEEADCPLLWVIKWVDYSNKYGFGYQLSDSSTGVLLNDGTHITFHPHIQMVCYCRELGETCVFPINNVPSDLTVKVDILQFFSQYMLQKLLEGGDLYISPEESQKCLYLLHFMKSDQAVLMLFSNGLLQVNFYRDHTKIVLSNHCGEYLLTFINQERKSSVFSLSTILLYGCWTEVHDRLEYALSMLQQL